MVHCLPGQEPRQVIHPTPKFHPDSPLFLALYTHPPHTHTLVPSLTAHLTKAKPWLWVFALEK